MTPPPVESSRNRPMPDRPKSATSERTGFRTALVLGVLSLSALLLLGIQRGSFTSVIGDEGTYLAMIESLAIDGDLAFSEPDIERAEAATAVGSKYLILHRVGEQFFYSKPAVYPALVAPVYRLAGSAGPILFNCLALGLSLWLAWLYLQRFGRGAAALALTTFVGPGLVLVYCVWTMGDALQVACVLAGTSLCLGAIERGQARLNQVHPVLASRLAPWAGGAVLGLLVAARITNVVVAGTVIGALLVCRRWRKAAAAGIALLVVLAASFALNQALLETPRPYKAVRATFDPGSGYPGDASDNQALARFEQSLSTVRVWTRVRPRVSLYAGLYFLVGRHSGILVYLPAALIFLLVSLRRPDRIGLALLAGVAGLTAVYLLWFPHNYFGGGAVIGNRYFLPAYPLLLFAPTRLPRLRWQLSAWLVATLAFGSAWVSVSRVHAVAPTSQSHAQAGLFRLLPYESVASDLEGNVERFWLEEWELVRFADPYAKVGDWSFVLDSGSKAAEIEVANTRADGLMRFLVLSPAEDLELIYEDWGKEQVFHLSKPMAEHGVIEISPSRPWRIHQLWFAWMRDTNFYARVFRLSIRSPDGTEARARLSYLGPTDLNLNIFRRQVLDTHAPPSAGAGTSSLVNVRVRNQSKEEWTSERVLPVYLSYRLTDIEDSAVTVEGPRARIGSVAPNEILDQSLEIEWPVRPATYRLDVDLLVEGVAWFASRSDGPLLSRDVVVGVPVAAAP